MLPINLQDLNPSHIQSLIDSEVAESQTLEYKQQLPSGQSEEKREFLYDIAAMANSGGGDLVYGIVDRRGEGGQATGIAERASGVKLSNPQPEIDRLANLIRDGIEPRISGIVMQAVNCPGGDVVVIRVPNSWNRPHMVTIGGVNKFFGRTATGKYPMSVDEISRAFSGQRELGETIRRWRMKRVALIARDRGPVSLSGDVKTLFHVIPASAFSSSILRESWKLSEEDQRRIYVPKGISSTRYNADGFLALGQAGSGVYGYTQVFRSGIIEYADAQCSGRRPIDREHTSIFGQEIERQMVSCYQDAVTRLRSQGRTEPLYLGLSLVGISGKPFYVSLMHFNPHATTTRRNTFVSAEVYVDVNEPEERPYRKTLLPLADTLWQLAGREGSPFKTKGVWEPFKEWE
ncbi:MAG: helix-turn-helix domain-containing protein [Acidobacteriota bacterium]